MKWLESVTAITGISAVEQKGFHEYQKFTSATKTAAPKWDATISVCVKTTATAIYGA
jgi:hypothetical protein